MQDLGHPKIYFLEEGSESSEPGPSNLSDTVTTAYSGANERDGSSRMSSCQVKTSPSTNGAITKTSYPQEETAPIQLTLRHFPWTITAEVLSGTGSRGSFLDPQSGLLQMCLN